MSWKKIVILFVTLVVIATGVITYLWYQARQAGGVDIAITAPDSVEIGVPFTASIAVSNTGSGIAQQTSLALSLPDGFVFMSEAASKRVVTKSLGSLGTGTVTNQEFRIMPVSGENNLVQLEALLSYIPTDLGSRFEKQAVKDVSIGTSGISLDIAAPQKIFAGETFEVKVDYKNESITDFHNLQLLLQYPRGFTFVSSTLHPDEDNTLWKLGDLRAGSQGSFTIKGTMTGPDNAFFDFVVGINTSFLGKEYAINQKTASISIAASPFSLVVTVNDRSDYVATANDVLTYELTYTNNTDIGLKDVIITARLIGTMFDQSRINSHEGVVKPNGTIEWNAARVADLAVIRPGETGSVSFSAGTLSQYPIRRISDKNFTLKMSAEIESPSVPQSVASSRTIGSVSTETKVGGTLRPSMSAFFKDKSGIKNTGPLPLKVAAPTTFTMYWTLRNEATDMDGVTFKTFLGPNVRYTGTYVASNGVAPEYNTRTQEFIWRVGRVSATKGIIDAPLDLAFQVEITPSSDQLNQFPVLLGETTVTGTDLFTSGSYFDKLESFATLLINDPQLTSRDTQVNP